MNYTFHALTQGHRSLIDWLFISSSLQSSLVDIDVLDIEPNQSDHLPVVLDFKFDFDLDLDIRNNNNNNDTALKNNVFSKMCWEKSNLDLYYSSTSDLLQNIFNEFDNCVQKNIQ